ncbi:MAG: peptidyl-prolyl cis-trans isomerase [Candidatus Gastranaerophilales bacterium]|nr:peptidyl-prolyl cis-trans isomerase [Candidatus Gastranaerophilales bacterium]
MKFIMSLFCVILAVYCMYFPYSYFHKEPDKKEIRVSHILVNTEEEAKKIKEELAESSFEELAEKYSLCQSKSQKGDIGYYERGRLLPEFEKEAYKMEKNIVSEPIETREGWHLVKIYDIKYFSDREDSIQ